MLQYGALTASQRRAYFDTVTGSHHRRIEVVLLNRNTGKIARDLTDEFLGGSIQGDVDRIPVTVCELDVLDEDEALDWSNGRHRHYLVRVVDGRFVPDLNEWVEATVFTGPLWDYERSGDVVSLSAQGMERLAMGSLRSVFHRPRKARATGVIRDLLSAAGARKQDMSIPGRKTRLPESVTVGVTRGKDKKDEDDKKKGKKKPRRRRLQALPWEDNYWTTAHEIAEAIDRDLFANGPGKFILARHNPSPMVRLRRDLLLQEVTETRANDGEQTNTWLVLGHKPKGKPRVQAQVQLPKKHPASPAGMVWHGRERDVTVRVENGHLRTKAQARKVGIRLRNRALGESVQYQVSALPVLPWLRPGGKVTVATNGGDVKVTVRQWTLPLGPGPDPMTIGANRRRGWH